MQSRRRIVLVQLPIPPAGPQPIRGNVLLAAAYLKMYAEHQGLGVHYDLEILPTTVANGYCDEGIVAAILARDPWMVGFTSYLWNIDRNLHLARRLKECRPDLRIVLGGPEITADNGWVLANPAVDYAVIGEGEQTFADLLSSLRTEAVASPMIPGLHVRGRSLSAPMFRSPLASLDPISSPYLEGILDAADEKMLFLETIRGCVFKCKFCYYPKSYDDLYFVSEEKIVANLRHAQERGAKEVILLDPTLNQRKDFPSFLRLLARCNPERQFTYFGELRGEGITPEVAKLLAEANFTEVEIGLQSVDPHAQKLMDRRNHLKSFERGARAMMELGISVKVDLIVGLPGDTVESVRQGIEYLHETGLYDDVQVFNLAILPGTAFREEAKALGLEFQPRPPYYVLKTPTLTLGDMYQLMEEAQDTFEIDFDPQPPPLLDFPDSDLPITCWRCDFSTAETPLPPIDQRSQAFTLWFRSKDFREDAEATAQSIRQVLIDNPHTTLQVVLEPIGDPYHLTPEVLETVNGACQSLPTYLDRFYGVLPGPGRPLGAKRMLLRIPLALRGTLENHWLEQVTEFASLVWDGELAEEEELEEYEYVLTCSK